MDSLCCCSPSTRGCVQFEADKYPSRRRVTYCATGMRPSPVPPRLRYANRRIDSKTGGWNMKSLWSAVLLVAVSAGVIAIQTAHAAPQHLLRDGGNGGLCPNAKTCK